MIRMSEIGQFRGVVYAVNHKTDYVGLDEAGEPMYETRPKPVITFTGTVKLHGTNAGVSLKENGSVQAQSKSKKIGIDGHFGFGHFVEANANEFKRIITEFAENIDCDPYLDNITLMGEWAGKGIQKEVAISELEKAFYIFGAKMRLADDENKEVSSFWVDSSKIRSDNDRIRNVSEFKTYEIDIDFENPASAQNVMIKITEAVEAECPVAKHYGTEGIGEGVVWLGDFRGERLIFKVKGEKHSVTKVKKLAEVDIEKMASVNEFVNYAVTPNRVNQAIEYVFSGKPLDIRKTGEILKWVNIDILKEELDTMTENNLEPRDVNKAVSMRAKQIFFKQLQV